MFCLSRSMPINKLINYSKDPNLYVDILTKNKDTYVLEEAMATHISF